MNTIYYSVTKKTLLLHCTFGAARAPNSIVCLSFLIGAPFAANRALSVLAAAALGSNPYLRYIYIYMRPKQQNRTQPYSARPANRSGLDFALQLYIKIYIKTARARARGVLRVETIGLITNERTRRNQYIYIYKYI